MTALRSILHSPAPAPAPAQAPAQADDESAEDGIDDYQKVFIEVNMLLTFTLLLFLFSVGRMRRCVRSRYILQYGTKICYLLVPMYLTYIMGLLHKDNEPNVLSPVWASALIYAYGGVVTITACDLKDNDGTLRYVWNTLPLFFWTAWLLFSTEGEMETFIKPKTSVDEKWSDWISTYMLCTNVFFMVLAIINIRQTLVAFYQASKSKGLPHLVGPIAHYMDELADKGGTVDPRLMKGYNYVVWGNPKEKKKITTIEEIWEWVHTQEEEAGESTTSGRKNKFLAKCVGKGRLRDICLSFALFRMLLTRFAGFTTLRKVNSICARQFIQEGLLDRDIERVFRVIEVELDFLFDFFYTKSHACGSYRFRDICQHLVQILLLVFFATVGIPALVHLNHKHRDLYAQIASKVIVTFVVILIFAWLELFKYIMVQLSNRKIVWLVCTGIREAASKDRWATTTELRIVLIWTIKHFLMTCCAFSSLFKPWQRKLGQYSFLESYGRVPVFSRKPFSPFAKIVKLPRAGQRGDSIVSLSQEVKQAIVSSLRQNRELKLHRGTDTLRRYGLAEIEDVRQPSDSDALFILVWHIATGFCESNHPIQSETDQDHGHFLAAIQLSKYCAYLLAFAPELLPDHPYTSERCFDEAVERARRKKKQGLDMHQVYEGLTSGVSINNENIVERGALLARELVHHVIQTPNRGWKVLAEFWAELLLYLAPTDDVGVHGDYLARGGEFITHLWVLLTHAGVFARESSS